MFKRMYNTFQCSIAVIFFFSFSAISQEVSEKPDTNSISIQNKLSKVNAVEPNDQYFLNQWNLKAIRVPDAWEITKGSAA